MPKAKPAAPMTLDEAMAALEAAGSAQTRKTYLRHGAGEPLFGVSFASLKGMVKRIGVDHDLARKLWATGNHDARVLAMKVADPAKVTAKELDAWAKGTGVRMCGGYVAMLAEESGRGAATAERWLGAKHAVLRASGWALVEQLALRDADLPDAWFLERLAVIEKTIHDVTDEERDAMNSALISTGGRNPKLRAAALAAAKRIGPVVVDHGDTACKTPPAGPYIEKMWTHAKSKKFASPAEQERKREAPRTRC